MTQLGNPSASPPIASTGPPVAAYFAALSAYSDTAPLLGSTTPASAPIGGRDDDTYSTVGPPRVRVFEKISKDFKACHEVGFLGRLVGALVATTEKH